MALPVPVVPVLCHRCGVELTPGAGNFYVVCIEAFADPSPPIISAETWKHAQQIKVTENRIKRTNVICVYIDNYIGMLQASLKKSCRIHHPFKLCGRFCIWTAI